MALLTSTPVTRAGVDFSASAFLFTATTGDTWANTGKEYLAVTNNSGGNITATIPRRQAVDGAALPDLVVTCVNARTTMIGPFQTAIYNDGAGLAKVTLSAVSSVGGVLLACTTAS